MGKTMYSSEKVEQMRIAYPINSKVVVYRTFPRTDYHVDARGIVVAHNRQGVIVEVVTEEDKREHSRALKPGYDRFELDNEHGLSREEALKLSA